MTDIHKFKPGEIVKMNCNGTWCYGEITIVRETDNTCKVLFTEDYAPSYDYYPFIDLYKTDWIKK